LFSLKNLLLLPFLLFLISGCKSHNDKKPSIIGAIEDNTAWYDDARQHSLLKTRVSIPVPNDYECAPWDDPTAPPRPCTLEDVLMDKDAYDDYEPELHVHYENDEFPAQGVNASLEQKGKSTRDFPQASFRIKLDSKTDLYLGERTFQLNKHPFDKSRVRNKLFFELFETIPNFTSLRTRFVDLSIDDVPYGLFTHVEKCDEIFLKNHNFSEDDNLYKAQNFTFELKPELELNEKGDPVDPEAFDSVIEIENGKETQKLIDMINAIDAAETDEAFTKVFNKYFDRDNYITWLAINIVTSNKDTVSQNFFLLNPYLSDKFYFLPWDYDGAGETIAEWEDGIGNWWGIPLHKKFLKIKQNRDDLDAMVYTIREKYMNDTIIQEKLDIFKPIVEPYIQQLPDSEHLALETWQEAFDFLRNEQIALNLERYESQKGRPMPFWQQASYQDGNLTLVWGKAYDFEGDKIVYRVQVTTADDVNFTSPLIDEDNIDENSENVVLESWGDYFYYYPITLDPGEYLLKVTAYEKDNPQSYQVGFDIYRDDDNKYYGVLEFSVE